MFSLFASGFRIVDLAITYRIASIIRMIERSFPNNRIVQNATNSIITADWIGMIMNCHLIFFDIILPIIKKITVAARNICENTNALNALLLLCVALYPKMNPNMTIIDINASVVAFEMLSPP